MKNPIMPVLAVLLILLALGWYIDSIAHQEISSAVRFIIYALAFSVIAVLVGMVIFAILIIRERVLKERASRKMMEREAKVMYLIADEGQQVYIRDTDNNVTWRNAHLDTRVFTHREPTEPSQIEITAWQTYQLRNKPSAIENVTPHLLPAQTRIDLLAALDTAQCALIVGQRDAGKTTLLQHVISRRLNKSHVLVLDPHSHPIRWPEGCAVVGTERDFPKIANALNGLMALMDKRYREIGKGLIREGEHPSVTVVIDEWRAIVYNLGKPASDIIKSLLAESRKTNIDVFVGTHSERVKALGIEGEGDLKEGFVIVRLTINKITKQRRATVDYGDGEISAVLPGPYNSQGLQTLDRNDLFNLAPEPTPEETRILEMYKAGESFRTISRVVFEGKVGQFYNQKIQAILEKYGEK
jgi:hypothetical protein